MRSALLCVALLCIPAALFAATSCTNVTSLEGAYLRPIQEEQLADADFEQVRVDLSGCSEANPDGCAKRTKELNQLSKDALAAVSRLTACAGDGIDGSSTAHPDLDAKQKTWYEARAGFWYGLVQDLGSDPTVNKGTYQFGESFITGYLGLPASLPPTLTTCTGVTQPAQIDTAEQLIQAWPVKDCGTGDKSKCQLGAQQLRNAVTATVQMLQYCAANPPSDSGPYDKAWYTQEALNWEPLDIDMTIHAQQIADGSYLLPASWKEPVHPAPPAFAASPYVRALLGGTYSAASGTDPQGKLLADLFVDLPFIGSKQTAHVAASSTSSTGSEQTTQSASSKATPIKSTTSLFQAGAWGFARIGSIGDPKSIVQPSQIATQFASLSSGSSSQVVQSFEMNAGMFIQWNLHPDVDMFDRVAIAAIAGGGALTPVSPGQTPAAYFEVTPSVEETYGKSLFTACSTTTNQDGSYQNCYLQLYNQDRSRFFRTVEGGIRLKAYPKPDPKRASAFPAMFDVTYGKNEYVTGGTFEGWVLHLGGSAPVFATGLYVFGSMDVGIRNHSDLSGPILIPANLTNTSGIVIVPVAIAPYNRDRYSIGFGIDVVQLIRNHLMQDALAGSH